MESLAVVQVNNLPVGGTTSVNYIKTLGTLDLKQQCPIHNSRDLRTLYNDDLFSYLEFESLETFLSTRYYGGQRNETTIYNYGTPFLKRGLSGSNLNT
jgi:hypothetical protein